MILSPKLLNSANLIKEGLGGRKYLQCGVRKKNKPNKNKKAIPFTEWLFTCQSEDFHPWEL
ncbi:MAG: hypothetical protein DRI88_08040 [Bacteroidetes bacterium]|nr:MAG: hypothetical protein DRI72_02880 [Bacteroidota bacterium]RLD46054.1 MAG: hypothetical protein DRI88_08040 [Bacteroidota bacterium]RLD72388.1 MAG: hypothetical protein DRI87_05770 [Bacteroidota bacterium]RLD87885.1 MAG: hypothetical protein DRJ02_05240 [Bacteroidota bacterium]